MFHSRHWLVAARASRRVLRVAALSMLTSAGALVLALSIEACSTGDTSGQRIVLDTRVELAPNAQTFTTALGWDVTLSRVLVSTGPFYYFDGAPPLVRRGRPHEWRWPSTLETLGIQQAFAQPGQYKAGDALGQMLSSWSIDLLAGPADLPAGDGVTGIYRSASFSFTSPPEGPMANAMESHAAIAEGTATRAGFPSLTFVATADLADIERSAADGYIDGCEFTELDIADGGRISVQVNPKIWFDLVDFAELTPAANAQPVEFPPDSQPKIAFALGLAQLSAYKFSFSAP
jgi:hypothetical protein